MNKVQKLTYRHFIIFIKVTLCLGLLSCSGHERMQTPNEFVKWLNTPENGYYVEKNVGNIRMVAKLLPSEYLAINEASQEGEIASQRLSDLKTFYDSTITFLFTIGPAKSHEGVDITKADIQSEEQYRERFEKLNFHFAEYIRLDREGKEYVPVLTRMENVYGLTDSRNFYVVFSPQTNKEEFIEKATYKLSYYDEFFETGITKFSFKEETRKEIPELKFWR